MQAKCKPVHFGRGQAPNPAVKDELDRHVLEPLNAFKDLVVVLFLVLKHYDLVDAAVKKARNAIFLISRVFRHLPTKVFLRAFPVLVRLMFENCIQVWSLRL